jgi:hypothetical protein
MLHFTDPQDGWAIFITEANYNSLHQCYLNGTHLWGVCVVVRVNIAVTCRIHVTFSLSNTHINIVTTAMSVLFSTRWNIRIDFNYGTYFHLYYNLSFNTHYRLRCVITEYIPVCYDAGGHLVTNLVNRNRMKEYRIWGSHSGGYEEYYLLESNVA